MSNCPIWMAGTQAAAALLLALDTLDEPIHQLMIDASHRVAGRVTERQDQVRQHNRIGLALTGFLLAAVLVFAGIALRQMRAQVGRHRRGARVAQLRIALHGLQHDRIQIALEAAPQAC